MQSDDSESTDIPSTVTTTPTESDAGSADAQSFPPLRREAVVNSSERNRSALVAVCCSFAGVGIGFGLGQMASVHGPCTQHLIVHESKATAPTPEASVTWLGVEVQSSAHALPGAHVTEIIPGSPAERAGLAVGDVVVGLGETTIRSSHDLVRAVRSQPVGRRVLISTVNYRGQDAQRPVELAGIAPRVLRQFRHHQHLAR